MIVDDESEIVNLFRLFLSREGHIAITATDGYSCLKKIREIRPDCILLDIMMAPIDGWKTLKAIKDDKETADIPVIMVTGKPLLSGEYEKYGKLYHKYLMKPVPRRQLCDIVNMAIQQPGTA